MNVGVIGLGRDGLAVARQLLAKTSHDLLAYDPDGRPAPRTAIHCGSAAELCDRCRVVVLALHTAGELCRLLDAVMDFMREGQIFLALTDMSPALAHSVSNGMRRRCGARFLDCGLLGERGLCGEHQLFVGGSGEAFALALPLIRCFSPGCRYMGPSGRGSAARILCRSLAAQRYNAAAETRAVARALGLQDFPDLEELGGAEGLPPLERDWEALRRDTAVAAEMARRAGLRPPGLLAAEREFGGRGEPGRCDKNEHGR